MNIPDIPTFVPRSVVGNARSFFSGGVLDVIWKALVSAGVLASVYVLAAAGLVGGIIATLAAFRSMGVRAERPGVHHGQRRTVSTGEIDECGT